MKNFLNNMVLTVVLVVTVALTLTGCEVPVDSMGNEPVGTYDWFYRIGESPMVYAKDTHVVYYREKAGYSGYMAPYYNEHGQLCRYVDGQIVPIE